VVGERLCDYYTNLAIMVETNHNEEQKIDQASGAVDVVTVYSNIEQGFTCRFVMVIRGCNAEQED